tara:strand:- start:23 stop:1954 length:1932 start_codon:yes stop_codon:yes gene_type:complete
MVQAKVIMDAIFAQTSYTYSADSFFNDNLFKQLYIDGLPSPSVTSDEVNGLVEAESTGQDLPNNRTELIALFPNEILDNGGNYAETVGRYHVPQDGTYTMFTTLNLSLARGLLNPSVTYEVEILRRTPLGDIQLATSGLLTTPIGVTRYSDIVTVNFTGILTQDVDYREEVYVKVTFGNDNNHRIDELSKFEVTAAPFSISVNQLMKYDVKSIDFLKSIISKFKLVMVPNPDNEFQFIIKPWKDYIGSGDRFDWTTKLDLSKDITLKPIFFEQSQIIDFKDQPDEDHNNKPFQDEYNRTYGALQFDSQSDMLTNTRTIETIFAPTPVNLIEGDDVTGSEFIIPYFSKLGTALASHDHLEHVPMKPKLRLLFWNGIAPIVAAPPLSEKWYYTDGTTTYNSSQTPLNDGYPRMTPYSEFPTTSTTLNLNWFREVPLFPNGEALLGESVYERYWNKYTQELYSPLARIFTGYFNLDSNDLRKLSFDDIIFIQNAYFRVLKVYDAPITDIQTVKVDLVKLLDSTTFANNGTPTPSGGGIDDVVVVGSGGGPGGVLDDNIWSQNDLTFSGDNNTWSDAPLLLHYIVQRCDGSPGTYTVSSVTTLTAGQSVNLSGAIHAGFCYEVVDIAAGPGSTSVIAIFPDCLSCEE